MKGTRRKNGDEAGGVEGYAKLTLAELRNGISDTKSAIHRCKEALDNLRQPKTVGLQATAICGAHLMRGTILDYRFGRCGDRAVLGSVAAAFLRTLPVMLARQSTNL